jgi:phosphoribosyl-ATP pyrophosphohydrolase
LPVGSKPTRVSKNQGRAKEERRMPQSPLQRLYEAVLARRGADPRTSRTAKLLAAGRNKMAQKLGEEAIEVAIDAVRGNKPAVIEESADLLYHLVVLWAEMGIEPKEIWAEMERRERAYGIAEKARRAAA